MDEPLREMPRKRRFGRRARREDRGETAGEAGEARSLKPLRIVYAAVANYPGYLALAGLALVITAAATLAIPAGFKMVIDRGFAGGGDTQDIGRWFRYLLMIVAVPAASTATIISR